MLTQLMLFMQDAAETISDAATDAANAVGDAASDAAAAVGETASDVATAAVDATNQTAAAATTAVVDNPYSLEALWAQGDIVAKGTLIILLIMSLFTWYILFFKLWEQQRLLKQAKTAAKNFWSAKTMQDGVNSLEKDSAFRAIVEDGLKAVEQHEGALSHQLSLADWVQMSLGQTIDIIAHRLQGGLAFLASVGSTAPFIGLFGTVWGIYHALVAIGMSGQASIDKVAGPVGEALIMTAIGLAVAVPAVLGYNWLVRRNKLALEAVRGFSNNIYTYLLSGHRDGGHAASAKVATGRSH